MSLCPHCNAEFKQVNLRVIKAVQPAKAWNALSYDCPSCDKSLSVGIDVTAIREDIINALRIPNRGSGFQK